jgi:ABC-2 type transport system permease protein
MEDKNMNNLANAVWIESRKALRSRMPLWTALGSLFMPVGIALLIALARSPAVAQKLGLIGAKANLMAYSATDWPAYLKLSGEVIAAGGFFFFVIVTSWVFGREFVDGTLKDMLAVPVQRASILLAKFIVVAVWSAGLTLLIFAVDLIMGATIKLPGGSSGVILHGGGMVAITALLAIGVVFPFAFFASMGRGYLLPMALAVLAVMMANLVAVIGWGEYFPWGVPGLYVIGDSPLTAISYWIVALTGLAGMFGTYLWWKYADQNR